jgi:hypothetical protein
MLGILLKLYIRLQQKKQGLFMKNRKINNDFWEHFTFCFINYIKNHKKRNDLEPAA